MSKISIKQLKAEFDALLLHKKKIDPEHIVNLQIFENFEQKYHKTVQNSEISSKKTAFLQNELKALGIYLKHFSLFLGLYEQFLQREKMAKKDAAFHQASHFINIMLETFTEGKYVEIGVIEQIDLLRNALINLQKKPENIKKTVEKSDNIALFDDFETSKSDISSYFTEKKLHKNSLSAAEFAKLKKAYDDLKQDMMRHLLLRKKYKYNNLVNAFSKALRSQDAAKMQVFLGKAKKEIVATRIEAPKNKAILDEKLVNISGKGEANSNILLIINNKQKIKLEVDKIGAFYLENLELNFGENTIIYENESFGFLLEKPSILTVQLNKIHLFLGRYDPLTQKAFEIQELNDIVRCKDCRNFLYDFSVEENEGRCMIKNCESKAFYNAKNAKFWVK